MGVKYSKAERAGHDCQFAPPAQEKHVCPHSPITKDAPKNGNHRQEGEPVFDTGPKDQLRRTQSLPREREDQVRGKAEINMAKSKAVQEKCEEQERKARRNERSPTNRKPGAPEKPGTSCEPEAGKQP